MDTSLMDCLVMTLFSAVACISFPRVLTLIGSSAAFKSQPVAGANQSAKSDLSQPMAYPELTTVNN